MSAESETPKSEGHAAGPAPFDPFEVWRAARDAGLESLRSMRDASLESSSKMLIDFVNSEAYSQATAQWLNTYLAASQPFQQALEKTMTQALTGLNMPTRADVISLATRLTNIEMRLDDLDAKLDEMQHAVQALFTSSKDDMQHAVQTLATSHDEMQRAVQALSTSHNEMQRAVEVLSAVKDAVDRPTTGAESAGPGTNTDMPAPPQPQPKKTSRAKQGKAKEAH